MRKQFLISTLASIILLAGTQSQVAYSDPADDAASNGASNHTENEYRNPGIKDKLLSFFKNIGNYIRRHL